MKTIDKAIQNLSFVGLEPITAYTNLGGLKWFFRDYQELKSQLGEQHEFPIKVLRPMLQDKRTDSGVMSGHYFHQDLLVAKAVFRNAPARHVDIGSRTDGFVAHVASFREIEVFDIRPLENKIGNIKFVQADFMKPNPSLTNYTDSISSLHAIEHFGLGRYNDPIDANGHLKGLSSIHQVLQQGGKFYFSTPIGPQRIEFNAHRVFNLKYLLDLLMKDYSLDRFSYVDDAGDLHESIDLTADLINHNCHCHYGCGIFELTKR